MNNNEEKIINEIIKKTEDDNRELLDYVCYSLFNYFCELLNKANIKFPEHIRYENILFDYDGVRTIKNTRTLVLKKTLDYYNKQASKKNCLPTTIAKTYNESDKLKEEYLTLEDYVLSLYKNNCDLFDEKEWKTLIYNSTNENITANHNITFGAIGDIVDGNGKIFKTLLKRRLDKEFYITENGGEYTFQLERYLNEVYYSQKKNDSDIEENGKNLIKKI